MMLTRRVFQGSRVRTNGEELLKNLTEFSDWEIKWKCGPWLKRILVLTR